MGENFKHFQNPGWRQENASELFLLGFTFHLEKVFVCWGLGFRIYGGQAVSSYLIPLVSTSGGLGLSGVLWGAWFAVVVISLSCLN